MTKQKIKNARVAILMGSDSDLNVIQAASQALEDFGIPHEMHVISAHRAPLETAQFAKKAKNKGIQVIIAGAGGAAHLPGVVAAYTELPVIGVPIAIGHLQGQDALYSIVQMPKGVPVATVGIGNAYNAGILAAQILASGGQKKDQALFKKIRKYKENLRKVVLSKNIANISKKN